ncbi:MAG: hypothetical protein VXY77_00715 [Pseudomonadota bacterium]|nr:hypothetical protein [Pseudomonadota bacterium]
MAKTHKQKAPSRLDALSKYTQRIVKKGVRKVAKTATDVLELVSSATGSTTLENMSLRAQEALATHIYPATKELAVPKAPRRAPRPAITMGNLPGLNLQDLDPQVPAHPILSLSHAPVPPVHIIQGQAAHIPQDQSDENASETSGAEVFADLHQPQA